MSDTDQILDGLIEQKFREIQRQLAEARQALSEAAQEINCAGPVAHRIRILKQEHATQIEEAQQAREQMNREIAESLASAGKACQELAGERDTYARLLREVVMAWAQLRSHVTEVDLEGETDFERAVLEMERVYAALKAALFGVSEPASERCPNCTREVPCDIHDLGRCGL